MSAKEKVAAASGAVDYSVYVMGLSERIMYILLAAAGLFVVGYVFYHSLIMSAIFAALGILFPKIRTQQIISARKRKLTLQFKDMLYSLSSAVGAGSSVESAMSHVLSDLEQQYGDSEAMMVKELELMVSKLSMNQNIEDVFADFAERSGIEDVKTFANIFEISKRTGGNMVQIIRQTVSVIAEKIEIQQEMQTLLSGKKMEQRVLTVVPVALVFMLTITTDGFMEPIFTTVAGRIVATIALVMIGVSYFWSKKITDIQI